MLVVKDVFEVEGGIAVVATNTWSAIKGQRALEVDWDHGEFHSWDSKKIKNMMEKKSQGKAAIAKDDGNVNNVNNDLSYEEYKSLLVEYGKNSKFPDIN